MQTTNKSLFVIAFICIGIFSTVILSKVNKDRLDRKASEMAQVSALSSNYSNNEELISPLDVSKDFFAATPTDGSAPATTSTNAAEPADGISASSYMAANVLTGMIYASKNPDRVLPVASMSKLVTAFAATDILSATTSITITDAEFDVPPDGSGITVGETYSMSDLLYPLLLNSSNVAAEALASSTNRSNFVELMSSYAWEIGMSTAYFADPSGVDPHNAASANDLIALAKYLYKFRPDILRLTRTIEISVGTTTAHGAHNFTSIHPYVKDPDFIGGKTGRTPEAGDTMLTILNINDQPVAIVVLGSKYDGRADDTRKIADLVRKQL